MTQTAAEAAQAAPSNGQAPAPDAGAAPCEDCAGVPERLMGLLGLAFALALGVIAADLLTGGALSRAVTSFAGGGGGQPGAE